MTVTEVRCHSRCRRTASGCDLDLVLTGDGTMANLVAPSGGVARVDYFGSNSTNAVTTTFTNDPNEPIHLSITLFLYRVKILGQTLLPLTLRY